MRLGMKKVRMNPALIVYNIFSTALFVSLFPFFGLYAFITGRHRKGIGERLGFYPPLSVSNHSPRIWIHAASVGEVRVAVAIIESLTALVPTGAFILTTTTEHGRSLARKNLKSKAVCLFAPIDTFFSVRKAFSILKPDILVCIETEIWPNMLAEAHRRSVQTALVNGRISVRSIKRYLLIRPFMKKFLQYIDVFSMIRDEDARRIRQLGAPAGRVVVNGNSKFDLLLSQALPEHKTRMMKMYNLKGDEVVFVAGSTRRTEERVILDVYERIVRLYPGALLILAPRHVNRSRHIESLVKDRGLSSQFRTDLAHRGRSRSTPVVILDTIGELQATYSIATIVFCGGSLVPLGGQNILEAAVWGKPVFYGPSMEDFQDAQELIERFGGGIQVADGPELAEKILSLLADPKQARQVSEQARKAVEANRGAAGKHAQAIHSLLTTNENRISHF